MGNTTTRKTASAIDAQTQHTPGWRFDYPMIVSDTAAVDVAQVLYSGDETIDRATGAMIVDRLNAYDRAFRAMEKALTAIVERNALKNDVTDQETGETFYELARAALAKVQS